MGRGAVWVSKCLTGLGGFTGFGCSERLLSASDLALVISLVMASSKECSDKSDAERCFDPENTKSKCYKILECNSDIVR